MTRCPDPAGCPVADSGRLVAAPRHTLRADTVWARCYDSTWGYDEPNPGFGDTRFAPFRDAAGTFVPTMYLAENAAGADRCELLVVADETDRCALLEQPCNGAIEGQGVGHACFVDDDETVGVDGAHFTGWAPVAVEVVNELGERVGSRVELTAQLVGCCR